MGKQDIGVMGMAVMGQNLALNISNKSYSVSIYNRSSDKTREIIEKHQNKGLMASYSIEEFVKSLEKPRKIIMMVQAGRVTDSVIEQLLPHLEEGDILMDGGNAFFQDTIRRERELSNLNINFLGVGISGGGEGALLGPSIMVGGERKAYNLVSHILEDISAKTPLNNENCLAYIGPNGAGHYIKMVHNGIEYGDMQLIAEAYHILTKIVGLSIEETAKVFEEWNKGELESYLIEITANILKKIDPKTRKPMVDIIKYSAKNKRTGKWTSQNALDLGTPLSLITESVFARFISSMKEERVEASKILAKPSENIAVGDKEGFIEIIRQSLYFSKIISYAQGFAQMKMASQEYNWNLNYGEIAKVFRAGCIIRAGFLQKIAEAYDKNPNLKNLILDKYFTEIIGNYQNSIRNLIGQAVKAGIAVPALSSAISYYDSYRSDYLPANMIQAQRDYFGAHTYQRIDEEGIFTFDWYGDQGESSLGI